jgi:hypothetical protein
MGATRLWQLHLGYSQVVGKDFEKKIVQAQKGLAGGSATGGRNPNIEIRNPKQIQTSQE